ncbi:MAG TPA: FmdB family zinc ribbon protein [Gemmatimonadaceae bacterium]
MPTYEFRCPNGHEFTHFYKTMSTALTQLPCPECGAVADRQLSAGAGLVFKGSGFYLTDYGRNAHRGGEKSSTAVEAGGSSGEKKDTSTAAKTGGEAKAEGPKPKAESSPSKAESPKPKAESTKPKTDTSKPKAE